MKFEPVQDARGAIAYVTFSDDRPGNAASMRGPDGRSLEFRRDLSSFDDRHRAYSWGFALGGSIAVGDKFTFSTEDRAVEGEVVAEVSGGRVSLAIEVCREGRAPAVAILSGPRCSVGPVPKVSVITCTYDRPELLRVAVQSLRDQTDADWEHLIYDNGSMDARVAVVLRWAEEDRRVRVWRGSANVNQPSRHWNFLLDRARGRYLTVLDDDNRKLPQFVEAMAGELDRDPGVGVVTCGFVVENAQARPRRTEEHHGNLATSAAALARGSTCDGGATLYRREVLEAAGYFSEALRTNEDWDWMRRAAAVARVKNLRECHATYRMHGDNRMVHKDALGHVGDEATVRGREVRSTVGARVIRPDPRRLTRSQVDATGSVDRALAAIPWVHPGEDLAVVVAPFQLDLRDLEVGRCRQALSIHFEDPYATEANLDRVRHLQARVETWVCTNDRSAVSRYREVVGDRVVVCPMLGADEGVIAATPEGDRDVDVLLCGYAYPSRRRFMGELLVKVQEVVRERELFVALVGDGWVKWYDDEVRARRLGGMCVVTMGTQDLATTYAWHARARAVACLHRSHGDCCDGPNPPVTLNRGFMEGALGPRVFVDRSRPHHALDSGDVVFYDDPEDLAVKLTEYLAGTRAPEADAFFGKCRQLYTYRARMTRVINCVRSPRYLVEIP